MYESPPSAPEPQASIWRPLTSVSGMIGGVLAINLGEKLAPYPVSLLPPALIGGGLALIVAAGARLRRSWRPVADAVFWSLVALVVAAACVWLPSTASFPDKTGGG